jgi:hypothetical protein
LSFGLTSGDKGWGRKVLDLIEKIIKKHFLATYLLLPCSTTFAGIDSIEMNMKDQKMTVVGDVDPVDIVNKLKKYCWYREILTVGPAKEEKKEEPKKEEPKKDDKKKEEPLKCYCEPLKCYCPPSYYYIPCPEDQCYQQNCVIC